MKKSLILFLISLLCLSAVFPCISEAAGQRPEVTEFKGLNATLKYIKDNRPLQLNIGHVSYKPQNLKKLLDAMPAGSQLFFENTWNNADFSEAAETLDFSSGRARISPEDVSLLISLLPGLKEIDLGKVSLSPSQLLSVRSALPEDGVLRFESSWGKADFTESAEELDLNKSKKSISVSDLEVLIELLPGVKKINVSGHRELGNKEIPPLIDKYPEIEFVWLIRLPGSYSLASDATAYSTAKSIGKGHKLTSDELGPLHYAKGLRALDLGHNAVTDLSFLRDFPEMRILILADNDISDLSPLSDLKHLQYLEIFMNDFSDLTPLQSCTELLDLNISRCDKVRDLSPLDALPQLERFWSPQNNRMPKETKDHFLKTHPDCESNFTNYHCTSGTWRYHWRYKQYVAMFKSHVWTPFVEPEE